jgi:hypothetical protein
VYHGDAQPTGVALPWVVRSERGGGKARTSGSSRMQALSLKGEITIAS